MKITWENVRATKKLKIILVQFILTNGRDSLFIGVK